MKKHPWKGRRQDQLQPQEGRPNPSSTLLPSSSSPPLTLSTPLWRTKGAAPKNGQPPFQKREGEAHSQKEEATTTTRKTGKDQQPREGRTSPHPKKERPSPNPRGSKCQPQSQEELPSHAKEEWRTPTTRRNDQPPPPKRRARDLRFKHLQLLPAQKMF